MPAFCRSLIAAQASSFCSGVIFAHMNLPSEGPLRRSTSSLSRSATAPFLSLKFLRICFPFKEPETRNALSPLGFSNRVILNLDFLAIFQIC